VTNDYDTFERLNRKYFGSVYEEVKRKSGQGANPLRFPAWPNPVNYITNYEILACEDTMYAHIVFAAGVFTAYGWQTFVPSPAELTRKLVLNDYKCGFYFGPKVKSPLRLFFPPGGVQMIAEMVRPFTKFLWYWWIAESAFGAFDAWQTVMHREEFCEEHACTVVVSDLGGIMVPGTRVGVPALGHVDKDPCAMDPGGGPNVIVGDLAYTASATFTMFDPTGQVTSAALEIWDDDGVAASEPVPLNQGGPSKQQIIVHHGRAGSTGVVRVRIPYSMNFGAAGAVDYTVTRWIVSKHTG